MNLLRVLLLGLAIVPALCAAQWRWVDKSGRTVFSDQPPPADIPAANVVSQPKGRSPSLAAQPVVAASAPAARTPSLAASAAKLSAKDKDLQDKKKQADAADAEKRKAQEEEAERLRAENCLRAQRAKATLDSGMRVAVTNKKGEQEILDDTARATETKRLQTIIEKDCKPAAG
jgi:Domain of unknown function (DUF4124)